MKGSDQLDVFIQAVQEDGLAKILAEPTLTATRTDENGKFSASTYDAGDGAPEGEYSVTFEWNKLNTVSMSFDGDKLDGKYNDPKKSTFKIKVEDGKPADMGKIELTTK